jgi:hypothetical protein
LIPEVCKLVAKTKSLLCHSVSERDKRGFKELAGIYKTGKQQKREAEASQL